MAFVAHGPGANVPPPISRNPEEAIDTVQDTAKRQLIPAQCDAQQSDVLSSDGVDLLVCGCHAGEFLVNLIVSKSVDQSFKVYCSQHPMDIRTPSSIAQHTLPPSEQSSNNQRVVLLVRVVEVNPPEGNSVRIAFVAFPPKGYASVMHDTRYLLKLVKPKRVIFLDSQSVPESSMDIDTRVIGSDVGTVDESWKSFYEEMPKLGSSSVLEECSAGIMVQSQLQNIPALSIVAFQPLYTSLEVLRVLYSCLYRVLDDVVCTGFHKEVISTGDDKEKMLKTAAQQLRTRREGSVGAMFM